MKTYSLAEVAAMALPSDWADPERWLARRISRGEIPGYRLNHTTFRMTEQQLNEFIAARSTGQPRRVEPVESRPAVSVLDGLSEASRRRLKAVGS